MMILLEKIKWMTCVFLWVSNKMADYAVIHKKGKIHCHIQLFCKTFN